MFYWFVKRVEEKRWNASLIFNNTGVRFYLSHKHLLKCMFGVKSSRLFYLLRNVIIDVIIQIFHTYTLCFWPQTAKLLGDVLWTTQKHCARGRRPRTTVHLAIHSSEGVIVLTVAQKGMKYWVVLLPNSELTKGNNMRDADADGSFTTKDHGG